MFIWKNTTPTQHTFTKRLAQKKHAQALLFFLLIEDLCVFCYNIISTNIDSISERWHSRIDCHSKQVILSIFYFYKTKSNSLAKYFCNLYVSYCFLSVCCEEFIDICWWLIIYSGGLFIDIEFRLVSERWWEKKGFMVVRSFLRIRWRKWCHCSNNGFWESNGWRPFLTNSY